LAIGLPSSSQKNVEGISNRVASLAGALVDQHGRLKKRRTTLRPSFRASEAKPSADPEPIEKRGRERRSCRWE